MAQNNRTQCYQHETETRPNNPTVGLAPDGDIAEMPQNTYAYNPHLQPVLRFDADRDTVLPPPTQHLLSVY